MIPGSDWINGFQAGLVDLSRRVLVDLVDLSRRVLVGLVDPKRRVLVHLVDLSHRVFACFVDPSRRVPDVIVDPSRDMCWLAIMSGWCIISICLLNLSVCLFVGKYF